MSRAALRAREDVDVAARPAVSIRSAVVADLDEVTALERAAWPAGRGMRADASRLRRRIELGGLLLATDTDTGRAYGMISTFRPSWARRPVFDALSSPCPDEIFDLPGALLWRWLVERHGLPRDWHAATGDGRLGGALPWCERAGVVFGVGIATAPDVRGSGIASRLIRAALDRARREGAAYFVAYGRLPQFHRHPITALDSYLTRSGSGGAEMPPYDIGLRLHWSAGARPLRSRSGRSRFAGIPNAMPGDFESRGFGCLIVNPLQADRCCD